MDLPTPHVSLGGPSDPSRPSGWALQSSEWASRPLPDLRKDLSNSPAPQGGPFDPSRPYRWDSRPFPALREGLTTLP